MHFEPGLVGLLVALDCPEHLLEDVYRSLCNRVPPESINDAVAEVEQAIQSAKQMETS